MTKTSLSLQSSLSNLWEDYVYKTYNIKSKAKAKYRMSGASPRYKVTYNFNPKHLSINQIYDCIPNHPYNKKLEKNPIIQNQGTEFDFLLGWHFDLMKAISQYRGELKKHMHNPNILKRNYIKYKKEFDIALENYQDVKAENFEWLISDAYINSFRIAKKSWHKTYDSMAVEICVLQNEYVNRYYNIVVPAHNESESKRILSFFKWGSDLYFNRTKSNFDLLKINKNIFTLASGPYSFEELETGARENKKKKSWIYDTDTSFEKEIGTFKNDITKEAIKKETLKEDTKNDTNNIVSKKKKKSTKQILKEAQMLMLKSCFGHLQEAKNILEHQLIKLERKERKARYKLIKREMREKNLSLEVTSDGHRLKIQFFKIKPKLTKQERQEKIHAEYGRQEKRKAHIIGAIAKEKEKIRARKALLNIQAKIDAIQRKQNQPQTHIQPHQLQQPQLQQTEKTKAHQPHHPQQIQKTQPQPQQTQTLKTQPQQPHLQKIQEKFRVQKPYHPKLEQSQSQKQVIQMHPIINHKRHDHESVLEILKTFSVDEVNKMMKKDKKVKKDIKKFANEMKKYKNLDKTQTSQLFDELKNFGLKDKVSEVFGKVRLSIGISTAKERGPP